MMDVWEKGEFTLEVKPGLILQTMNLPIELRSHITESWILTCNLIDITKDRLQTDNKMY